VSRIQRGGSPTAIISLIFLPNSSSDVLTRLSGPRSRPTISQKIWKRRESNPDLWICSLELWPLDYRGGPYILNIFTRWDHSNYALRRTRVMKLLIMQLSPTSCHSNSPWSKYSPQDITVKNKTRLTRSLPNNIAVTNIYTSYRHILSEVLCLLWSYKWISFPANRFSWFS
jgi:hypothetical protein